MTGTSYEIWRPDENAWQPTNDAFLGAFLRVGNDDIPAARQRLHHGEILDFNGYKIRWRRCGSAQPEPLETPDW